ncbi:MAG: TonB-dependent receptor [Asticcacaulis sp.]|uniref:TonB-dependent receptor n=1 Tax=Asticcacaulis sp. TaxID=1872648 RepID=UPI0039E32F52
MKRDIKIRRGVSALAFVSVIGAAGLAGAVHAQSETPADSTEVIVTAQKKSEKLLSVPVPVTAVKSDTLVQQNLLSVKDYFSKIPGMQYGANDLSSISLRGITTGGGTNPTIAVLIDDVPFGSSSYLGQAPLPDLDPSSLDRLEVLRGPQGTLYGASSLGGILKFVTKDPTTNFFSGRLEAGYVTVKDGRSGSQLRGALNVPLIEGKLALSVNGFLRDDPAWIDNINTAAAGEDVNKSHKSGGRIALTYKPIDRFSMTLAALDQDTSTLNSSSIRVCETCQSDPSAPTTFDSVYGDTTINLSAQSATTRFQLYSARETLDLGWGELTSISAWGHSQGKAYQDVSSVFYFLPLIYGTSGGSVIIDNENATKKFSQELRLSGSAGKFDWLVGGFYTKEDTVLHQVLNVYDGDGAFFIEAYNGATPSEFQESAIFGNLTYHATDKFTIQAGVRTSRNKQNYYGDTYVEDTASMVFGPSSVSDKLYSDESATTWQITPSYKFSNNLMGYARFATGYRPGGPNTVLPGIPATFESDTVMNSEIGLKGYVLDRKMTIDLSLFQIDWDNIQLPDTDTVTQFQFFTNGGSARSRGFEGAVHWVPIENLSLDANLTLTDAVLTEDLTATSGVTALEGKDGDRLPFTSKVTSNLSAQKVFVFANGIKAFVGGTVTYVGDRMSEFHSYDPDDASTSPRPRFKLPGYTTVDLRGGVSLDKGIQINAYVKNLTNDHGVIYATNRNGTSSPTANFLQPTTIGVSVAKSF